MYHKHFIINQPSNTLYQYHMHVTSFHVKKGLHQLYKKYLFNEDLIYSLVVLRLI